MHPILFHIGTFRLPTYGTLLVTAILAAVYTVMRLGRREGLDAGRLLDLSTWVLIVALVCAKVLMVISDWSDYGSLSRIFSMDTLMAGGVFYGGFLAAVFFAVWYIRAHGMSFWKVADVFSPAIALGQSIGRWGCFAGGCDYGKPTQSWLGVVFTNPYAHEIAGVPLGVRLYQTQLLESLATLTIFGMLLWRYRKKSEDGEIFVLYLGLYAIARFFLEFLRGDEDRGFVFNHLLSTSQFIGILALLTAVGLAIYRRRHPSEVPARAGKALNARRKPKAEAEIAVPATASNAKRARH